jgi:hypothetical protein
MNNETTTVQTVHDLRHRWKPHKERLLALKGEQATSIRFHRACSWMARAEQMPDGQDHDLGLISLWITVRHRAIGRYQYGAVDPANEARDAEVIA